jgi:hypothetical protein
MTRSLHRDEREQVELAYPPGVHPIEPLAASYPFPNAPPADQGNRDAELDGRSGIPEDVASQPPRRLSPVSRGALAAVAVYAPRSQSCGHATRAIQQPRP